MGKNILLGAIVLVGIVLLVLIAGLLGFIDLGFNISSLSNDEETINPENTNIPGTVTELGYSNREIHQVICFLTGKNLPFTQHEVFIEGLHMNMWGVDDTTAIAILTAYEEENSDDDFTSYDTVMQRGVGWTAYTELWYNDIAMGRAITVGDGSAVHGAYDHDVVLLVSNGVMTDYYDYATFLESY